MRINGDLCTLDFNFFVFLSHQVSPIPNSIFKIILGVGESIGERGIARGGGNAEVVGGIDGGGGGGGCIVSIC